MARIHRLLKKLFRGWTGGASVLGAALGLCGVCSGQVIRLNPQTQVARQQDVRLGDIALVTATDPRTTEELASTVIVTGVEHSETIKAETVLLALLAQHGAAAVAGNLQISGAAACEIRVQGSPEIRPPEKAIVNEGIKEATMPAKSAAATQPPPATPVASTRPAMQNGVPATMPGGGDTPTLTSLILARVEQELNAGRDDVRVSFETISPLLEQPLPAGRRWVCRTLTRVPLGTVQFEAQLVEGGKVIDRLTVQTRVERKQMVLVATAKLTRGDLVTPDKMRLQEAWMDRRLPTLFSNMGEALGLEAQKDLEIGSMLDQRDFKPLLMAHRNDPVNVIYIAGALEVQMSGQAMADARLKEQVEIRNPKTGERYTATMVAKGIAVAGGALTEEQELKLRETR